MASCAASSDRADSRRSPALGHTVAFPQDDFSISLGGETLRQREPAGPDPNLDARSRDLRVGGRRLSPRGRVRAAGRMVVPQQADLGRLRPRGCLTAWTMCRCSDARLGEPVRTSMCPKSARPNLGTGDYGAAIRLADNRGFLAVVQNPFLRVHPRRRPILDPVQARHGMARRLRPVRVGSWPPRAVSHDRGGCSRTG